MLAQYFLITGVLFAQKLPSLLIQQTFHAFSAKINQCMPFKAHRLVYLVIQLVSHVKDP